MSTIAEIIERGQPFGDEGKPKRVSYKIRTSDGVEGEIYPYASDEITVGLGLESSGTTKRGVPKFRVVNPGSASGSSSGSTDHGDKMRSKEQCIRGEALIAAASCADNPTDALKIAPQFAAWIAVGGSIEPVPPAQAAATDEPIF